MSVFPEQLHYFRSWEGRDAAPLAPQLVPLSLRVFNIRMKNVYPIESCVISSVHSLFQSDFCTWPKEWPAHNCFGFIAKFA